MSLSQTQSIEAIEDTGLFKANDTVHAELRSVLSVLPSMSGNAFTGGLSSEDIITVQASPWRQVKWLVMRELLNAKRDTGALFGKFGVIIFLSLLLGVIFLGAGNKDNSNPNHFAAHFGAVTFISLGSMFIVASPVMLAFPYERPLFMREYSTGTCKLLLIVTVYATLSNLQLQHI